MKSFLRIVIAAVPLAWCLAQPGAPARRRPDNAYRDWRVYGGGPESIRYSTLDQINRDNVRELRVAWNFDTGDAFKNSEMQCNPIVANGLLYVTTPKLRILALDPANGKLVWRFDPYDGAPPAGRTRIRGVTYWEGGGERRIYFAAGPLLYSLDASTGKPAREFGNAGRVDLRQGLGRDPEGMSVGITTPPVVYKDLLIAGSIVSEDLPSAPGDIRAFDARTGKVRWTFHTIPHPGEFGYETWPPDAWKHSGGANNWAGMSVDEKRGLVFVPTGSAAFDFYGADRPGDNLFANCLIALKAETGERVWHFQAVRHDLWDRDFPAPPSLVTVERGGKLIDAVAQITKSGHVFVFERETGKPLFPIEYRNVPGSPVDGEWLAKQQPFPLAPPPFARQRLTEDMLTKRTPEARRAVLERFRKLRNDGPFTPPSLQGTIVFPGFDGGGEWGGAGFDPETGLLYVNANEMAWVLRLIPREQEGARVTGRTLYVQNCAGCHRPDLRGSPPEFPSLAGIASRRSEAEVEATIRKGADRMPAFAQLGQRRIDAIVRYLMSGEAKEVAPSSPGKQANTLKYVHDGYNKLLDPEGYPGIAPPWGTLTAIDLDKGEIAWQIPLGEFPELAAKGLRNTGSENYGGPLVTAGGLVFIGATIHDRKFRAFDKATGKLLWETSVPASGNATPATYEVNGRQYIVIAAGGGKWGAPSGGTYVAFALPAEKAGQTQALR